MIPVRTIRQTCGWRGRTPAASRGFAMMLVMMLVAIGVVLGIAYLSSASLKVKVSQNFLSMSRARYLAESGLEHALYTLRFSPDSVEDTVLGPYYADASSDYYYIYAQEIPGETGIYRVYRVSATATVGGIVRTSSANVYRGRGDVLDLRHSLLVKGGLIWLPWGLTLNGDIHVNGSLFNMADVTGDASATDTLSDPWQRIDGNTTADAEKVEFPDIETEHYTKYTLDDIEYEAAKITGTDFTMNDPLANGGAVTEGNIGGVVELKLPRHPEVDAITIHENLNFTGMLMIEGDLIIDGADITLTAVEGFPALVVTGKIYVTDAARNVTINGLVVVEEGIHSADWTPNASTTVNGAVISKTQGYDSGLFGSHTLNYDPEAAAVFDMTVSPDKRVPIVTVLEWND